MALGDPTWDFTNPASKERLLGVLQGEIDQMRALVADPARWQAPTACAEWEVRDVIGHLVDTAEGYLTAFDIVRSGGTAPEPLGLHVMSKLANEGAKAYRKLARDELLGKLDDGIKRLWDNYTTASDEAWSGTLIPHKYMGPVPLGFYAEFQLIDYTVHGWDIREGIGLPHVMAGDAADLLVPVIHVVLQYTADLSTVKEPYSIGIRVTGNNSGDVRFDVSPAGVQFAPAAIDDCPAVLEFDPASYVLTAYGRTNAGTVRGDRQRAADFRSLIFRI